MVHDHGSGHMTGLDLTGDLHTYLCGARETLVWKLDGLDEYDIRRPLTRTGTNLLGLVHVTAETQRHAGHADIVRELIDGAAGLLLGFDNLQIGDQAHRDAHYDQVEQAAHRASSR